MKWCRMGELEQTMDQVLGGNRTEDQLLRPSIGPVHISHWCGWSASGGWGGASCLFVFSYVFSFFVSE